MQSFLIIASDITAQKKLFDQLQKKFAVALIDIYSFARAANLSEKKQKSIGVEDVRIMQKTVAISPSAGKKKIVVFEDFDTATQEAQNALLKLLEEPPHYTIIILLASATEKILPTILSRVTLLQPHHAPAKFSSEDNLPATSSVNGRQEKEYAAIILSLSTMSVGKRLTLAQNYSKNKEDILLFLKKSLLGLRDQLVSAKPEKISLLYDLLKKLSKTYTIISSTNSNSRLAAENLFLEL